MDAVTTVSRLWQVRALIESKNEDELCIELFYKIIDGKRQYCVIAWMAKAGFISCRSPSEARHWLGITITDLKHFAFGCGYYEDEADFKEPSKLEILGHIDDIIAKYKDLRNA